MKNSTNKDLFVGIDYHQKPRQVCVLDRSGRVLANKAVANDGGEIAAVAARPGQRVRRVAIEACNGAEDLAEQLIERCGWSVELAHPGYVARMKGSPDKNDYGEGAQPIVTGSWRDGALSISSPSWIRIRRPLIKV